MFKFCKNCLCDSARYADGRCKTCVLQRNAKWAAAHRDLVNANSRAWNSKNGEKKRALNTVYRQVKQKEINEKRKRQRAADPSLERIKAAKRRALKKQNGGKLSTNIVQLLLQKQNGLCACCATPMNGQFHLDHIMPLSLGGANSDDNVQLLLPKCNLQKYNLHPEKFLERKRL